MEPPDLEPYLPWEEWERSTLPLEAYWLLAAFIQAAWRRAGLKAISGLRPIVLGDHIGMGLELSLWNASYEIRVAVSLSPTHEGNAVAFLFCSELDRPSLKVPIAYGRAVDPSLWDTFTQLIS